MYKQISIEKYFNNRGFTTEDTLMMGSLSISGASFPLEELNSKDLVVDNVPFHLCISNIKYDNIEINNQTIAIEYSIQAKEISFLGVSIYGDYYSDILFLKDGKVVYKDKLKLSNLTSSQCNFNNQRAVSFSYLNHSEKNKIFTKSNIWVNKICFNVPIIFDSIKFSDTPFMHVFSITVSY